MGPLKRFGVLYWSLFLVTVILSACSNTTEYYGQPPSIEDSKRVIVFQALGEEEDVVFTHARHAEEYWGNNCLACHNHTDVRDDTIWGCDEGGCHPQDEALGLCFDDDHNSIDCMAAQCTKCHTDSTIVAVNPAPLCSDCHMVFNTGQFFDASVEGLKFKTLTKEAKTLSGGLFEYRPGETITFSVGNLVIGSDRARAVMTPVDLVPGAVDENDPTVTNIARFLQTLDENGNIGDGITIPLAAHNAVVGKAISFTVDPLVFGANQDVLALISELNSGVYGTVFTDGNHSLVTSTDARFNLGWVLDNEVSAASETKIIGAPNTRFLLMTSHDTTGGDDFLYQWYRADTNWGLNEALITGALASTYQPGVADSGKWISFSVTPATGSTPTGTTTISAPIGPITAGTSTSTVSDIRSSSQVDQYRFTLASTTDVTIDVMSWEWVGGGGGYYGTSDIFGNGSGNDALVSNIWLFYANSTPVFGATGYYPYVGHGWTDKHNGRAKKNPIVTSTGLPAGDYIFSIGANYLSQADAWAGVNTDGSSWSQFHPILGAPNPNLNNYQIIFTFN